MGLHIENQETLSLIGELVALTGESKTAAITEAVRQRLTLIHSQRKESLSDRLLAIGRDCSKHLKKPLATADHDDFLYDELGLPKG